MLHVVLFTEEASAISDVSQMFFLISAEALISNFLHENIIFLQYSLDIPKNIGYFHSLFGHIIILYHENHTVSL